MPGELWQRGAVDRARYTATFHWPKKLELVASGHRLGGGDSPDGRRWERRACFSA